jgi:hypothetical protein
LVGTVKGAGIGQSYDKFRKDLSIWLYDNATLVGFLISMSALTLLWMIGIWLFVRHRSWWILEEYKLPKIAGIAIYCIITSMFLTILMGIILAIIVLLSVRNKHIRNTEPLYGHWLGPEQENN